MPLALKQAFVPGIGRTVKLQHRETMKLRATGRGFRLPAALPATPLPIDCTGDAKVSCVMDGNDAWGDCGEAMAEHADNILTFRQGKGTQSSHPIAALVKQYLAVSGGDNGLDEDMVVNHIWKVGIAGDPKAIICDALDVDVTDANLARFALDNFYTIQMAWSVPDAFLQGFRSGSSWLRPGIPDDNNGHYTPLADADAMGDYRVWTWGGWAWLSPSFVASVRPQCFLAFGPRQFDPATGLDSKGRHVAAQNALWVQCGGRPLPAAILAQFPPPVVPVPTPPAPKPNPIPPTPPPGPISIFAIDTIDHLYALASAPDVKVRSIALPLVVYDPATRTLSVPPDWRSNLPDDPPPQSGPTPKGLPIMPSIQDDFTVVVGDDVTVTADQTKLDADTAKDVSDHAGLKARVTKPTFVKLPDGTPAALIPGPDGTLETLVLQDGTVDTPAPAPTPAPVPPAQPPAPPANP